MISGMTEEAQAAPILLTRSRDSDPRANLPTCITAVKVHLDGLLSLDVFRLFEKDDLPRNSNLLGAKIIRFMKNVGTSSEQFKAHLVIQGHINSEKSPLVHD